MGQTPDRYDIAELVANAADLNVEWESVYGRYVRCPHAEWGDQCPSQGLRIHYARNEGGGHAHYQEYETPHRRLVVRLPAEPVGEEGR